MSTREQQRAILAHQQVKAFTEACDLPAQKKYRSITLKAQALIRNAGLCQALHFIHGKSEFRPLLGHLQQHLEQARVISGPNFLTDLREADLPLYLRATREALQCLVWQCRMVQSLIEEG